jgi:FlaA1/EpsC-like NDP-sugar epimerase
VRVLILGSGDHGQVVADALLQAMRHGQDVEPIGYLDDDPTLLGKKRLGLPVLGSISQRCEFKHDAIVVAIGENGVRARIFEELEKENERQHLETRALFQNFVFGPCQASF